MGHYQDWVVGINPEKSSVPVVLVLYVDDGVLTSRTYTWSMIEFPRCETDKMTWAAFSRWIPSPISQSRTMAFMKNGEHQIVNTEEQ